MATKIVKFKDVSVDTEFRFNNTDYIKIPEERISCCQANTAVEKHNPNAQAMLLPLVEVEVQVND